MRTMKQEVVVGRIGRVLSWGGTMKLRVVKKFDLPIKEEGGRVQYRTLDPKTFPWLIVLNGLEDTCAMLEKDPLRPDAPSPPLEIIPCLARHENIVDGEEKWWLQAAFFKVGPTRR